ARVEYEALTRAREYLLEAGVATDRFLVRAGVHERREVLAVRASNGHGIEEVRRLVRWPTNPSDEWRRGFLAGIFDACGRHDGEVTIECTDAEIIAHAVAALRQLGFDTVIDTVTEETCRMRLGGGLAERLRFLHAVDPAITSKRTVDGAVLGTGAMLA